MSEETQESTPTRRDWLKFWTIVTGAVASLLLIVPVLGYVLGALFKPRKYRGDRPQSLGTVNDETFPRGKTIFVVFRLPEELSPDWDGDTGNVGTYVQRSEEKKEKVEEEFTVFAINCTHLGCPVTWFEQAGLFLCPCHGGAYYANGEKASGPPPRGLYKYEHWIEKDKLMINAGHLPTLSNPAQPAEKEHS